MNLFLSQKNAVLFFKNPRKIADEEFTITDLFNVDHLYLKFMMSLYLFWDSPSAFSPSFSRPNLQTIIITYLSGIMCTNHFDKFRRNARTAPRITWQYKINAC